MLEKKQLELKDGDLICLDLGSTTPYKVKKSLIDMLNANRLRVSFVLNKSVKVLIKDDRVNLDTYKCRTAFKLGIPVYHVDAVYFYMLETGDKSSFNFDEYLIKNKLLESEFSSGKISKQSIKRLF